MSVVATDTRTELFAISVLIIIRHKIKFFVEIKNKALIIDLNMPTMKGTHTLFSRIGLQMTEVPKVKVAKT